MDEAIRVISNVGFPIFIAVWSVMRTEKILSDHTAVLRELVVLIREQRDRE